MSHPFSLIILKKAGESHGILRYARKTSKQFLLTFLIASLSIPFLFLTSSMPGAQADTKLYGDFNGDGKDDMVVGVPGEDVGTVMDAGSINVIYGSTSGLTSTGNQAWSQNSLGILGSSEASDFFGDAIAAGDFNGDGKDDLAIGVPGEDIGGGELTNTDIDQGTVNVIYGCTSSLTSGLCSTGNQSWNQDSSGIAGTAEVDDFFGLQVHGGEHNSDSEDFWSYVNY